MFSLGIQDSDNEHIDFALQNILKQNIPGPQLCAAIPVFVGCYNLSPSLLIQSAEKTCLNYSEFDIVRAMNIMSSENFVALSQTSVLSPMGIRQDIVSFDDKQTQWWRKFSCFPHGWWKQ